MYITEEQIKALFKDNTKGLHVTVFMPTTPKSNSKTIQEDKIRFKNAIQDIKNDNKYNSSELDMQLDKVSELYNDDTFWKNRDVGLALYFNKDSYLYVPLPYEIEYKIIISDKYMVTPLYAMKSVDRSFYVMDINITKPRLFRSIGNLVEEVVVDNLPESFINNDVIEFKKEIQHQTSKSKGGFHGHNIDDEVSAETEKYLKNVANIYNEYFKNHNEILVLSGTEQRVGNMRKHLDYDNILKEQINGSIENLNETEIYEKAIEIVEEYEQKRIRNELDKLATAKPEKVVSINSELNDLIKEGRVESLYLPSYRLTNDSVRDGSFDEILFEFEDLYDIEELVRGVLSSNGSIQATLRTKVDTPQQEGIQALLRY